MSWILLIIAGLLETVWVIGLKFTQGFTKLNPSLITITAIIASMYLLALAARTIPIGTAYPVWVSIGTFGAVVFEMTVLDLPLSAGRIFFLVLLLVAIVGLRFTSH